ncbi:MAG: AEC family transporter [Lachnospiraceae bacterium]|nr:AEC family transporter [Lachnospiraceae bacterium]
MSLSVILQQMGVICILVAIGIGLEKKGVVDRLTSKQLSAIVVDVCNPALILASILGGDITATHKDLLIAAALGVGLYAVLVTLGFVMPHILRVAPDKRRFYNLMTVYTNTGFLGIPVARAVLPANSIIYVIVVNVFYSLLFYTHGLAILGPGPAAKQSENESADSPSPAPAKKRSVLRNVINPGTVMALFALAVFWFDLSLPPILSNTVQYVGNATVFLSMALLGVNIARSNIVKHIGDARIWAYIVLRMVMLPVGIALALHAFSFDPAATLGVCLMAAVPIGNLPMIQAEKIGEDTSILSSAIAVTTAVSMITITAIVAVLSAWLM